MSSNPQRRFFLLILRDTKFMKIRTEVDDTKVYSCLTVTIFVCKIFEKVTPNLSILYITVV